MQREPWSCSPWGQGTDMPNGVAAPGTGTNASRGDHVHPVDTSRQAALGYTPINKAGDSGIGALSLASVNFGGSTLSHYDEGTWTPTFSGLTVVGTPTYTGKYTRIGRCVFFSLRVQSTTSTTSAQGATFFNLPVGGISAPGTLDAVSDTATPSFGVGLVFTDGNGYPPTWTTQADVTMNGWYFV